MHTGVTPPTPVNITEQFENDTIIIMLEWTVEYGTFNSLSVTPQVETVSLGPCRRQLLLSYNTFYNVSILANLCGQYSSHSIELHYSESFSFKTSGIHVIIFMHW